MKRRRVTRLGMFVMVLVGVGGFGAAPALAHPLGNFSVNHHDGLRFLADRIVNDAVVDTAEIPTAQADSKVDTNGDGTASPAELDAYGAGRCEGFIQALSLTVDGQAVPFSITSTSFAYKPGLAGLPTSRLECHLEARADLTVKRTVTFSDAYQPDRVGWHEITAIGDGARIVDSPVPQNSITDKLRNYPIDLLNSPLNVREATFNIVPGKGASTESANVTDRVSGAEKGFFSGTVDRVNRVFNDLIGRRELTLGVGLLAIALALLLGASHALLPGHGKTVMAAYIAGRQGSVRDAVLVGATVTGTHTGGVLLLGLALTLSTSLAGESVLGWLGVSSGLLVAGVGAGLLISAIRHRGSSRGVFGHGHTHDYDFGPGHSHGGHSHGGHSHGGHSQGGHSHGGHSHTHADHDATQEHDHDATHEAVHERGHGRDDHEPIHPLVRRHEYVSTQAVAGGRAQILGRSGNVGVIDLHALVASPTTPIVGEFLTHSSVADDAANAQGADEPKRFSRRGLVGMGIAGGLVPSPSALVILLSAIALGRTAFGILLVIGYGLGMAGTLTAAGVLLVKVRDRYQHRMQTSTGRVRAVARRWGSLAPYFTATLVLVVGLGLALRSLSLV